MTHKQAVEKLEKLAGGREWCLEYEWGSYHDNPHIHTYIDGPGHAKPAKTYAQAIQNMELLLNPPIADNPPEDEEAKS